MPETTRSRRDRPSAARAGKTHSTQLTETIQANVNADLERHFKSFLDDEFGATREERMFLREVFEWWESSQTGERDEIEIASAFQKEIRNRQPHILHVMDRERDQMLAYLKTLREQSEPTEVPKAPEPPPPARGRDRLEELKTVFAFFETKHDLELFEALRLITARNGGSSTPIENFLVGLLRRYFWSDQKGEGLDIDDIESELKTLREDFPRTLEESYFIADRYPRPEESNAE